MGNQDIYGVRYHFDNQFQDAPQKFGGVTLFQFGELYCDSGLQIQEHEQWCFEITYVISGKATFFLDGKPTNVSAGDVCVSPYRRSHAIHVDPECDLRYAYIGFLFNEDAVDEEYGFLKDFFHSEMTDLYIHNNSSILFPFMRAMEEFYRKSKGYRMMVEGYIQQILILTCRAFDSSPMPLPRPKAFQDAEGASVYSIIRYVEDNIFEMQTADEAAQALNYTPAYASALFKKRMGMPLKEYFEHKKIEKGIDLLKYGEMPLEDIAAQLRYPSVSSFQMVFQRIMGVSLAEYLERQERI